MVLYGGAYVHGFHCSCSRFEGEGFYQKISETSGMFTISMTLFMIPTRNTPDLKGPRSERSMRRILQGCFPIPITIKKIIHEYLLHTMIHDIIGNKYGLFLDLMAYSIVCENNAGQYYPDYAYNHPLFTEDMRIYSDSTVSDFLHSVTVDDSV